MLSAKLVPIFMIVILAVMACTTTKTELADTSSLSPEVTDNTVSPQAPAPSALQEIRLNLTGVT